MNAPASGTAARRARLDSITDRALGRKIVGSVIIVAEDGEVVYSRAAGLIDREAGEPMIADAIFRLASCTKPLVAATALALIDRGDLTLDDTLADLLPSFRPRLPDGSAATIRIRHLLTHTAGFGYPGTEPDDVYRAANVAAGLDQPGVGMEEAQRRLETVPLFFQPGAEWRYSMAIDVLGAVLARLHGGTLGDAVKTYVTGPLGMIDTDFGVTDPARLAVPYADGETAPLRMPDPYPVPADAENGAGTTFAPSRIFNGASFQSGGAGMAGTAGDFLRFLEAIRKSGAPILKPETAAMASRNQIGGLAMDDRHEGWKFGFLSGILDDPATARSAQTRGTLQWGGAYGHNWFIDPERRLSVVAFTNTAYEGCNGRFRDDIRDGVYR